MYKPRTCKIEFSTENAAFRDDEGSLDIEAVARAIERVAERIRLGCDVGNVNDGNGSAAGRWSLSIY